MGDSINMTPWKQKKLIIVHNNASNAMSYAVQQSVQPYMYPLHFQYILTWYIKFGVQCTMYTVQCTVHSVYYILCSLYSV